MIKTTFATTAAVAPANVVFPARVNGVSGGLRAKRTIEHGVHRQEIGTQGSDNHCQGEQEELCNDRSMLD